MSEFSKNNAKLMAKLQKKVRLDRSSEDGSVGRIQSKSPTSDLSPTNVIH